MTVKIEWVELEKLPNGIRYRKFINGKPTNNYKLELSAGDPTLDLQVGAGSDDCFKFWEYDDHWTFSTTSAMQRVGYAGSTIYKIGGGMRFQAVTIPQGATIVTAHLQLRAYNDKSGTIVRSRIRGEAADDTTTFSTVSDYDNRVRTGVSVDWDGIPAWTKDADYNSPSIVSVIQEIVNRGSWASGNAIVIFWDDHEGRSDPNSDCDRIAYSYNGSTTYAPKLHIEYSTPPPPTRRSFGYIIG